jgi:hypothetical protein
MAPLVRQAGSTEDEKGVKDERGGMKKVSGTFFGRP